MKALMLLMLLIGATARAEWLQFDDPIAPPPLNTPTMWARGVGPATCPGCTGNILALIWDTHATATPSLYPWPLYVQLTTDQLGGDAVGVYSRLYQDQTKGWAAAFHAEPFARHLGNTLIGYNAELHEQAASRSIGINLHMKEGRGDQAINIMTDPGASWQTGIALNGTGIDFGGGLVLKLDPSGRLCIWKGTAKKRCLSGAL